jgi:oligopeptide/dipeptide ABC transporter ATP-binding protein
VSEPLVRAKEGRLPSGEGRTDPLLVVEDLEVTVGPPEARVLATRDVSFELEQGMRLGIVGESGSGKSTTALAIMGLLGRDAAVTAGSIRYRGQELVGASEAVYRPLRGAEIAMVFQSANAALNPLIRVGDQIADVVQEHEGVSRADAHARAVEMLRAMGLSDPARNARAYPHQYSGGMAQRALLAMALASRPRVLLADEPTTGLDPVIAEQVLERVVEHVEGQSASLVLISHDIAVIAYASTHVAVMYAGSVMETGPKERVLASPSHPYTQALLGATVIGPDGRFAYIPGRVPTITPGYTGCSYRDRCALRASLGNPGLCATASPPMRTTGPDQAAACHFVGEGLNEGGGTDARDPGTAAPDPSAGERDDRAGSEP